MGRSSRKGKVVREITQDKDVTFMVSATECGVTVTTDKPLSEETKMSLQCLHQDGPEVEFVVVDDLQQVWEEHHGEPW